ncbi:type 1 fimbrial protein [Burkholderia sp. Bp8963]|uniref:type 1 fimbrial protein n=1 Tax=Burkholderia sp. Bp8963 TaxID=2184547 RepID=UPI000F5B7CFE|nr:type 1 fimbrial protein [Burkholderia sp. Bp8963]RQS68692.1 type 1 fimbrial protein [Burkholderia sp. Bp8963]
MKHRLSASSFLLAASLLASPPSFADGGSGIIHFTGMIVEPPCSFAVDAANAARASVRPECPRPASGQIAFVDPATRLAVKTTTFTQLSHSIDLPNRTNNAHSPMIAIVTYQ